MLEAVTLSTEPYHIEAGVISAMMMSIWLARHSAFGTSGGAYQSAFVAGRIGRLSCIALCFAVVSGASYFLIFFNLLPTTVIGGACSLAHMGGVFDSPFLMKLAQVVTAPFAIISLIRTVFGHISLTFATVICYVSVAVFLIFQASGTFTTACLCGRLTRGNERHSANGARSWLVHQVEII